MTSLGKISRRQFVAATTSGAAALALAGMATGVEQPSPPPAPIPTAPLAMWALTSTLGSADVSRQLDAFSSAGWGVVLYPRYGLELEYLSQAWFERIRFIVEQAAQRRMEVWLYDEFAWPSGHAKGLVTQGHPELQAQLLYVEANGRSHIESMPEGANLLMPEATQRFIAITHEQYAAAVGEFFGTTIRAIFTDEPSLAMQHRPRNAGDTAWRLAWAPAMNEALGGDFVERLARAQDRAHWPGWHEYWAAYARLFNEMWVAPLSEWCATHKLQMTGHFLGEESFGTQVAFNGSLRTQQATLGIPGIDEISTRCAVERCEALTLASMAELAGRERMVEVFALGPPSMTFDTMRKMVDLCASCGVDRYVMAICPFDLSGGIVKREYLGIHGPQQPWYRECARPFAEYVAEAATRARAATPLGVPWPTNDELWAAAGPQPAQSEALRAMTARFVDAARKAIRERIEPAPPVAPVVTAPAHQGIKWQFALKGLNALRVEGATLTIIDLPHTAELSVQRQLVRQLCINGHAVDLGAAPKDEQFDISYRRVPVAGLLRAGENRFEADLAEPKALPFLPALILWCDCAVDGEGRLVAPPETIALGDWRPQGFPSLCGTGSYRAEVEFAAPPARLSVDTGAYPARLHLNGADLGLRLWPPMEFDLTNVARAGRNEIVIEVTSTVGHLFVPKQSPAIGLFAVSFGG